MQLLLLLLVLVTAVFCQTGEDSKGTGSSATEVKAGASSTAKGRSGSWRPRARTFGWGADKRAPALRIRDGDRKKPARVRPEWVAWRKKHGAHRIYRNSTDEELHARILEETEAMVADNRRAFENGETSYTLAINEFADMTEEEIGQMRMSDDTFANLKELSNVVDTNSINQIRAKAAPPPFQFDWRDRITFTEVKNQQQCGSCYAFACVTAIEAQIFRKTNVTVNLSEQYIVDCSYRKTDGGNQNNGCSGGWMPSVFDWIINPNGGLLLNSSYPYTSGNTKTHGPCRTPQPSDKVYPGLLKRHMMMRNLREDDLKALLLEYGPLTVAMDAEGNKDFQQYNDGVYVGAECVVGKINHAVTLIGYGNENGKDYWIIRNSWGKDWGSRGYMKLLRGQNRCGITSLISWPVIEI